MSQWDDFVITTTLRAGYGEVEHAVELSRRLGRPYVTRDRSGLAELRREAGVGGVVVVARERVVLLIDGREFFFHPGLAKLRISEIMAGKTDQMIEAMALRAGDQVLDCTLGLGADAVVAAHVVGDQGRVVGLEAVPVMAELVRLGLEKGREGRNALARAMGRVELITADHRTYLPTRETNSCDVVYFDPMFRVPRYASSAMQPLRSLAEHASLDVGAVTEAVRVARRRVVLKERRDSPEFSRLGFREIAGGRYSPVAYGVIVKGGELV